MTGQIDWVSGSEPAFAVRVWGRGPAGYYGGACGTIPAGRPFAFPTGFPHLAQGFLQENWPFPSAQEAQALAENERWVGVTWRSAGEDDGRYLRHYKVDGDTNEFWGADSR